MRHSNLLNDQMITFDRVLQQRIGFGQYQLKRLGVIGFIDFVDGAQFLFITLLVAILKKQWNLNETQIQTLVSTYFLGGFFGALFSGIAADIMGRKKALIIGISVQIIIIFSTAFIQNIFTMILVRVFYGFVIGSTLPIGVLLVSEQSPNQYRGRAYMSLHLFFVLGKIYLLILASFFLNSLSDGNWRAIALCNLLPCFIMLFGTIFVLDESARFLFINGHYIQSFKLIDQMIMQNNYRNQNGHKDQNRQDVPEILEISEAVQHETEQLENRDSLNDRKKEHNCFEELSLQEQIGLLEWQNGVFKDSYTKLDRFQILFNKRNISITWRLWIVSIFNSLISAGTIFLLPFLLAEESKGIWQFFLTTIVQIPALILVFLIIDNQSLGRKMILNIAVFLGMVLYFVIYTYKGTVLVIGVSMLKFINRISSSVFTPLIAQSYSTVERSLGLAVSSALGRIMASIAPFLLYSLFLKDQYLPFLLYAVCTMVTLTCTLTFPVDHTGRDMQPDMHNSNTSTPVQEQVKKDIFAKKQGHGATDQEKHRLLEIKK